MSFPTSGDTLRISTWVDVGYDTGSPDLQLPGAFSPSSTAIGKAVVSGAYGDSDLVLDLTFPADLIGSFVAGGSYSVNGPVGFGDIKFRSGLYTVTGQFTHGNYLARFSFTYDSLQKANSPVFDVAGLPYGLISAVLEPDGLQFYLIEKHIADKVPRALMPDIDSPSIWVDETSIWLAANARNADTGASNWKLYRSSDGAQTFNEQADIGWASGYEYLSGISSGGLMLIGAQPRTGSTRIGISGDSGATWRTVATASRHDLSALYPSPRLVAGGYFLSDDLGETWAAVGLGGEPFAGGCESLALDGGIVVALKSAADVKMRLSSDQTLTYSTAKSIIPDAKSSIWKPAYQRNRARLIATNGRDAQFKSDDTGSSWSAY